MKELLISDDKSNYSIYFMKSIQDIIKSLEGVKIKEELDMFLVCDKNISLIYKDFISYISQELCKGTLILECSEETKSIGSINKIYEFLISNKAHRNSVLLSIGGGIIGDMVGFAASTYMRGISYINIPTTLISQTDSSIGGKVGYNFSSLKNVVGAFYNPKSVYICTEFLKTLPKRQFISGLGEVIKYALLDKDNLLEYLETKYVDIINLKQEDLKFIVEKSISIKKAIVMQDFKDLGIRNCLNLGHTIGHAIEVDSDYQIYHGEAVSLGILVALKLSEKKLSLNSNIYERIMDLYNKLEVISKYSIRNHWEFYKSIAQDKKNDKSIRFVLLTDIGQYKTRVKVEEQDIKTALKNSIEGDN